MTRQTRPAITLALAVLLAACSPQSGPDAGGVEAREAATPSGERPLVALEDEEKVADTVAWASMEIDEWRTIGVQKLIEGLKKDLEARGIDVGPLGKIDDGHIGAPLPRLWEASDTTDGLGKKRQSLSAGDAEQYFACPLYAPENNDGTPCADVVGDALAKVQKEIEQDPEVAKTINAQYAEMEQTSREFIIAWASAAQAYGAQVAAVYAEHELRAANACDDHANAETVSVILGNQQGIAIVEELRVWAFEQVKSCMLNTDVVAEQVRRIAKSRIGSFMEEHKVCTTADLSLNNVMLKEAEAKRKDGINQGIDQRVEILRQELLQERRRIGCCDSTTINQDLAPPDNPDGTDVTPPQSCPVGGSCDLVLADRNIGWQEVKGNCVCCRRRRATNLLACKGGAQQPVYCGENRDGTMYCTCKAIPLGSPLVIDLGGDGLELTKQTVLFDILDRGEPQRSTWIGRGEGLLAIDLDGDGEIKTGAELFGNRSDCGGERCYDGPEALKQYDRPARGGNGDGLIDAKDQVFAQLRVWVDANGDGRSQPAELAPLADHDIVSLNLDVAYEVERRAEGSITSRLEVMTSGGAIHQAYDVWFRLSLDSGELLEMLKQR